MSALNDEEDEGAPTAAAATAALLSVAVTSNQVFAVSKQTRHMDERTQDK
jgi:hypothetical protein